MRMMRLLEGVEPDIQDVLTVHTGCVIGCNIDGQGIE